MDRSTYSIKAYFEFIDDDDIRIKGTRIGIETILDEYLNAFSPEEISIRYPSLNLEQVYATITYYLHNKSEIDAYLKRWYSFSEKSRQQQLNKPTSAIKRLQKLKRDRTLQKNIAEKNIAA